MPFLSKDQIYRGMTTLHEEVVHSVWLGGDVLLRELTAMQRLAIDEGALEPPPADGSPAAINTEVQIAMQLQTMLVDPLSGTPYADGRLHPETGEPLIDPLTRMPYFTPDEMMVLVKGREGALNELLHHGRRLSRILPTDFRGRDTAPDGGERDAGEGADAHQADAGEDGDDEAQPADIGEEHGR